MPKAKQLDTKQNSFLVRLFNDDTLFLVEDLLKTGLYSSKNELLNKCIDIGVLEIAKKTLKSSKRLQDICTASIENDNTITDFYRILKQLTNTTDDLFVMVNIIEHIVTTIFNVHAAELNGEPISRFDMISGHLSNLPENLQSVKDEIIRRFAKKQ